MNKYRAYGKNYTDFYTLAAWLGSGQTFKNSVGSFRGVPVPAGKPVTYTGQLPDKYREAFLYARNRGTIDYVVYSYNTPITWHVRTPHGGVWVQPDVKYSQSTTVHQGKVAVALSNLQEAFRL